MLPRTRNTIGIQLFRIASIEPCQEGSYVAQSDIDALHYARVDVTLKVEVDALPGVVQVEVRFTQDGSSMVKSKLRTSLSQIPHLNR
jgi:hypothetical protein